MKQGHWKRLSAAALAAVSVLTAAGCGGRDPVSSLPPEPQTTSADISTAADVPTTTAQAGTTTSTTTAKTTASTAAGTTKSGVYLTTAASNDKWAGVFPVKQTEDIRVSAQKVNNRLSGEKTKLRSDRAVVSAFNTRYAYAHHPGLTYFKGKLYAAWSWGFVDEDAPGQAVALSTSVDGLQWSTPKVVAEPGDGIFGKNCLQSGYLFGTADKLYLVYCEKTYAPEMFDANGDFIPDGRYSTLSVDTYVITSTDGVSWSKPQQTAVGYANESPRKSLTGRWFAGAGRVLIRSDDPSVFAWPGFGVTAAQEEDAIRRGALMLNEASWFQTDDYILHMMLRSNAGYIWMSNSYDNGETWTDAYPTRFKSDDTMANFGRLPDGRFYFVGSTSTNVRYPLELYVSKNGTDFNKGYILRDEKSALQQEGWAKGGQYGYPEVLIRDGYMYVFYSKQKEVMELTRVALNDIG